MPAPPSFYIRLARPADGAAFIALVRGLAEFKRLPGPDDAAARGDAFGARLRFELLVVDVDPRVQGYALFFQGYSTFLAAPSLWLEGLFVDPAVRGRGISSAMMREVARAAATRGPVDASHPDGLMVDRALAARRGYDVRVCAAAPDFRSSGTWVPKALALDSDVAIEIEPNGPRSRLRPFERSLVC